MERPREGHQSWGCHIWKGVYHTLVLDVSKLRNFQSCQRATATIDATGMLSNMPFVVVYCDDKGLCYNNISAWGLGCSFRQDGFPKTSIRGTSNDNDSHAFLYLLATSSLPSSFTASSESRDAKKEIKYGIQFYICRASSRISIS